MPNFVSLAILERASLCTTREIKLFRARDRGKEKTAQLEKEVERERERAKVHHRSLYAQQLFPKSLSEARFALEGSEYEKGARVAYTTNHNICIFDSSLPSLYSFLTFLLSTADFYTAFAL